MEEMLHNIGLSDKEIAIYITLLKTPRLTAQRLSKMSGIQRTNTYTLLDKLIDDGLVIYEDSPVKRYSVADPRSLRLILNRRQTQLKQTAAELSVVIPDFISQYSLGLDKPGVLHMPGVAGFEQLLQDMIRSKTEILLVASDYKPDDEETLVRFRALQLERKKAGVHTRALFHAISDGNRIADEFAELGIETRYIGSTPFSGEVVIYEDKVAFTVYEPSVVVTIITNPHIASTLRLIFEELWREAKAN